ncbi:MAG: tRNA (N6-isopentenyl adenosine(37)-C2)-methylthiotransferase MiaB [Polyangiaceae bacterium]|nr:tRNA (N6-isopentenyl adenosine(37)-C2)-methylthiotransferase MiaB [Polyangiaceae bacterium]
MTETRNTADNERQRPTYAVTTFGCQMNVHDSQRMEEVLQNAGLQRVEAESEADVIVLNTCSVREKAEQKLRSEVGRLAKEKRVRRHLVLVVAGCVAQQEGERLLKRMPAVDLVIGPDNIPELPRLLDQVALGAPPAVRTVFDTEAPQFLTANAVLSGAPTAFVTTMKGCDERCSFCIVPYTRGPERYRPSDEIVAEIQALVKGGAREVTLLGQTVNSYRDPQHLLERAPEANESDVDESEFAALLRRIYAEVPSLLRLRYTSPHPRHLTPSLIAAHRDVPILAKHVHMPVQSGSDRMLRRMIRRYSRDEYVERTNHLRQQVPGLTLSTDIIVGFPGETDEDFAATLSLIEEVSFKGLFGFKYSPRPYTPALKLGDDISEDVKSERLTQLFELSEKLLREHLKSLVGTTQRVLIEGPDKGKGELWSGRTERNEIVHVRGASEFDLTGELVSATVVRENKHSLEAELAAESLKQAKPRVRKSAADGANHAQSSELNTAPGRRSLPMFTDHHESRS